jgi:acetyl esterase/lipase
MDTKNMDVLWRKIMQQDILDYQTTALKTTAKLRSYFLNTEESLFLGEDRPLVLVCPGGAYAFTSVREAEPVCLAFMSQGYHAAYLDYSVAPGRYPTSLLELAYAVLYLKSKAQEYKIRTDKIFLVGFSAGGHLVGSYSRFLSGDSLFPDRDLNLAQAVQDQFGLDHVLSMDDFSIAGQILSYPVMNGYDFANQRSLENLLGDSDRALWDYLDLPRHIHDQIPPTFAWHTAKDEAVLAVYTLDYVRGLLEQGLSAELHLFPNGQHGLSLANRITANPTNPGHLQEEAGVWIDLAKTWIKNLC